MLRPHWEKKFSVFKWHMKNYFCHLRHMFVIFSISPPNKKSLFYGTGTNVYQRLHSSPWIFLQIWLYLSLPCSVPSEEPLQMTLPRSPRTAIFGRGLTTSKRWKGCGVGAGLSFSPGKAWVQLSLGRCTRISTPFPFSTQVILVPEHHLSVPLMMPTPL